MRRGSLGTRQLRGLTAALLLPLGGIAVGAPSVGAHLGTWVPTWDPGLAASSHTCLGCHDGVLASNITPPLLDPNGTPLQSIQCGDVRASHPVGMEYDLSTALGRGNLKPRTELPAAIRLEDGRVGCISCHDMGSPPPARLAIPREGSLLCYACHTL